MSHQFSHRLEAKLDKYKALQTKISHSIEQVVNKELLQKNQDNIVQTLGRIDSIRSNFQTDFRNLTVDLHRDLLSHFESFQPADSTFTDLHDKYLKFLEKVNEKQQFMSSECEQLVQQIQELYKSKIEALKDTERRLAASEKNSPEMVRSASLQRSGEDLSESPKLSPERGRARGKSLDPHSKIVSDGTKAGLLGKFTTLFSKPKGEAGDPIPEMKLGEDSKFFWDPVKKRYVFEGEEEKPEEEAPLPPKKMDMMTKSVTKEQPAAESNGPKSAVSDMIQPRGVGILGKRKGAATGGAKQQPVGGFMPMSVFKPATTAFSQEGSSVQVDQYLSPSENNNNKPLCVQLFNEFEELVAGLTIKKISSASYVQPLNEIIALAQEDASQLYEHESELEAVRGETDKVRGTIQTYEMLNSYKEEIIKKLMNSEKQNSNKLSTLQVENESLQATLALYKDLFQNGKSSGESTSHNSNNQHYQAVVQDEHFQSLISELALKEKVMQLTDELNVLRLRESDYESRARLGEERAELYKKSLEERDQERSELQAIFDDKFEKDEISLKLLGKAYELGQRLEARGKKVKALNKLCKQISDEVSEKNHQISELSNKIKRVEKRVEEKEGVIQAREEKLRELETELAHAAKDRKLLGTVQSEKEGIQKSFETSKKELLSMSTNFSELSKQLKTSQDINEQLKHSLTNQLKATQNENEQLKQSLEASQGENEQLKQSLTEQLRAAQESNKQLRQSLEEQLKDAQDTNEQLEQTLNDQKREHETQIQDLDTQKILNLTTSKLLGRNLQTIAASLNLNIDATILERGLNEDTLKHTTHFLQSINEKVQKYAGQSHEDARAKTREVESLKTLLAQEKDFSNQNQSSLRSQIETLRRELELERERNSDLTEQLVEAKSNHEVALGRYDELIRRTASIEEKNHELLETINSHLKQEMQLSLQNKQLRETHAHTEQLSQEMATKIEEFHRTHEEHHTGYKSLRDNYEDLKVDYEELKQLYSNLLVSEVELQSANESLRIANSDLIDKVNSLQNEYDQQTSDDKEIKETKYLELVALLESEKNTAESYHIQLKQALLDRDSMKVTDQNEISTLNDEVKILHSKIQRLKETVEKLESEKQELRDTLEKLTSDLQEKSGQLSDASANIDTQHQQLEQDRAARKFIEENHENVQNFLNKLQAEHDQLKVEYKNLSESTTAAVQLPEHVIGMLTTHYKDLIDENLPESEGEMLNRLLEHITQNKSILSSIQDKESQFQDLVERFEALQQENQRLQETVAVLEEGKTESEEYDNLKMLYEKKSKRLDELNKELEERNREIERLKASASTNANKAESSDAAAKKESNTSSLLNQEAIDKLKKEIDHLKEENRKKEAQAEENQENYQMLQQRIKLMKEEQDILKLSHAEELEAIITKKEQTEAELKKQLLSMSNIEPAIQLGNKKTVTPTIPAQIANHKSPTGIETQKDSPQPKVAASQPDTTATQPNRNDDLRKSQGGGFLSTMASFFLTDNDLKKLNT